MCVKVLPILHKQYEVWRHVQDMERSVIKQSVLEVILDQGMMLPNRIIRSYPRNRGSMGSSSVNEMVTPTFDS